jgi:hypothetical protein
MASKTSKLVPIDKGPVDVTPLSLLEMAVQQGADAPGHPSCSQVVVRCSGS